MTKHVMIKLVMMQANDSPKNGLAMQTAIQPSILDKETYLDNFKTTKNVTKAIKNA